MTLTHLSGAVIQGTKQDKLNIPSLFGGWKELARTTLGSNQTTIDVTSLANKRYLMVLTSLVGKSANINQNFTLNNDAGNNYAHRYSTSGGADGTAVSQAFYYGSIHNNTLPEFSVYYLANYSTKEKLILGHEVNQSTAGATTAPIRFEFTNKWSNTSDTISSIKINGDGGSTYTSGSECVVLGYDPTDTHTTNFWEELLDVSVTEQPSLDTELFTAKKYMMFAIYGKNVVGGNIGLQFNYDTSTNYAFRYSINGGVDATNVSDTKIQTNVSDPTLPHFAYGYIINNSANEKLVIMPQVAEQSTAGAGNAPKRWEVYGKWANTTSQITSIQMKPNTGSSFNARIKVWGAN